MRIELPIELVEKMKRVVVEKKLKGFVRKLPSGKIVFDSMNTVDAICFEMWLSIAKKQK
jgi:hypothetical protein